jgi:hypothetical protein
MFYQLYSSPWTRTQSGTSSESARTGQRFRIFRRMSINVLGKIDNAKSKQLLMNGAQSKKQRGRN